MRESTDLLLGKLAVREGNCTQAQVDECLKMQSMSESQPSLGDLLLFKGYLTAPQLKDLLARQHKKVMACPPCRLSFTVLTLSEGRSARCPRCKSVLVESPREGPTRTDAEIATQRMRMIPQGKAPTHEAAKKTRMVCVICDQGFEWAPDASGRVRCPSCQSTFPARK